MIVIIDYAMGNLGSIVNMCKKIGVTVVSTADHATIRKAEKIILPGVGAFDHAMRHLRERNLVPLLQERALKDKVPFLGICLGMQLLTKNSHEGVEHGLSLVDAETLKFQDTSGTLRIPHMGWNTITVQKKSPLLEALDDSARFYFVHSYYVKCNDTDDILATTEYGLTFTSILQHENIFGAQFHPEKSHKFGKQLLKNFLTVV